MPNLLAHVAACLPWQPLCTLVTMMEILIKYDFHYIHCEFQTIN